MARLKDKTAVITGSGKGLGEAMALLFSREGAKIVVFDIDEGAGRETVEQIERQGGEGIFVHGDVSNPDDAARLIDAAVDAYDRVDILVNNAGIHVDRTVADTTEAEWDRILGVNLKGVFLCSKAAIPQMRRQGGGNIICISSISGLIGQLNQAAYNASKHGIIGLVKCMAYDHALENIRANAICPGVMNTPLVASVPEEHIAPYRKSNLLERFAEPIEVANTALFLASDESSHVTGSAMVVDGGYTTK
ncbi:MAG: glucose 1-dehydrogenase [Candidatus Poribacteria bacterium]|nr:glucose 1-dehydrogenase [Candidatus Poribacteria bacterium]MDE0506910.1 glucose 1-dehydrogenase [Candidatus Poribacteria bacterium]